MPDDKVFDKFYSLAYQNQSIGKPILGTKASVGGFNKDDLKEFCNQNYNPSNLIIGISGKFDESKIINPASSSETGGTFLEFFTGFTIFFQFLTAAL